MKKNLRKAQYFIYKDIDDVDFLTFAGVIVGALALFGGVFTYHGLQGSTAILIGGIACFSALAAVILFLFTTWVRGRTIALLRAVRDLRAAASDMVRGGDFDPDIMRYLRGRPVIFGMITGKLWSAVLFFIFGGDSGVRGAIQGIEDSKKGGQNYYPPYGTVPTVWREEEEELFTRTDISLWDLLQAIRKFSPVNELTSYKTPVETTPEKTPLSVELAEKHDALNEKLLKLEEISVSLTSPKLHELITTMKLLEEKRDDPFQLSQYATLLDSAEKNLLAIQADARWEKEKGQREIGPRRSDKIKIRVPSFRSR